MRRFLLLVFAVAVLSASLGVAPAHAESNRLFWGRAFFYAPGQEAWRDYDVRLSRQPDGNVTGTLRLEIERQSALFPPAGWLVVDVREAVVENGTAYMAGPIAWTSDSWVGCEDQWVYVCARDGGPGKDQDQISFVLDGLHNPNDVTEAIARECVRQRAWAGDFMGGMNTVEAGQLVAR